MTAAVRLPTPGTAVAIGGAQVILGHKYAEGGMSVVYLASPVGTEDVLAVKLLIERYKGRPERERRLLDEGRYLEQLGRSPHIVELVGHGRLDELDGWPFVATELMVGSSLGHVILRERDLSLSRLCRMAHELALAISFVHRHGIVHRDITTSNVFVCETHDGLEHVKLFDFSHAGRVDGPRVSRGEPGRLTGAFDVPGTHGYMSPEQARAEPATTAMDVFAFGAVLYELITRSPLFEIHDRGQYIQMAGRDGLEVPRLHAWAYEIPEALAELTNACIDLRPQARPSMDAVASQLGRICASLGGPLMGEATQPMPAEQLPMRPAKPVLVVSGAPAGEEATAVELAFARPPQLREPGPPPAMSGEPSPEPPQPQIDTEQDDAGPIAANRTWLWALGSLGLLGLAVALGVGWLWVRNDWGPGESELVVDVNESAGADTTGVAPEPGPVDPVPSGLEPVPEVGPADTGGSEADDEPRKVVRPKHVGSHERRGTDGGEALEGEAATPKHTTPECAAIRTETAAAARGRRWAVVLDHTKRSAACWAKPAEVVRLRVEAFGQTRADLKCIEAGESSDDPVVVEWVAVCRGNARGDK